MRALPLDGISYVHARSHKVQRKKNMSVPAQNAHAKPALSHGPWTATSRRRAGLWRDLQRGSRSTPVSEHSMKSIQRKSTFAVMSDYDADEQWG